MVFGSYDTPKPPTIPTFFQYLKTCGKGVEGKTRFQVEIVWLPGKFDNVTLQTHAFRYICSPDHPLYSSLPDFLLGCVDEGKANRIDLIITSLADKTIQLEENPKKQGRWERLGSNALKFKET